jgi:hypothetical protein
LLTLGEGEIEESGTVLFFKNGRRFGGPSLKYPGGSVDKPVVLAAQLASKVTHVKPSRMHCRSILQHMPDVAGF